VAAAIAALEAAEAGAGFHYDQDDELEDEFEAAKQAVLAGGAAASLLSNRPHLRGRALLLEAEAEAAAAAAAAAVGAAQCKRRWSVGDAASPPPHPKRRSLSLGGDDAGDAMRRALAAAAAAAVEAAVAAGTLPQVRREMGRERRARRSFLRGTVIAHRSIGFDTG
jgi:hypothetical protein